MRIYSILFCFLFSVNAFSQETGEAERQLLQGYDTEVVGEGEKLNNLKDGHWIYYRKKIGGLKYAEGQYEKGQKTGVWTIFYPNESQSILAGITYHQNTLMEMKMLEKNGDIYFELTSKNGLKPGTAWSIEDLLFGVPELVINVPPGVDGQSVLKKAVKRTIKDICINNTEEVKITYYGFKGNPDEIWYFSEGTLEITEQKFNFGVLAEQHHYARGNKQWKKTFPENDTTSFSIYRYLENGKTKSKQEYEQSTIKTGRWEYYHPSGKKKIVSYYKDDQLHGLLKEWDEHGELIRKEVYKKGQLVN